MWVAAIATLIGLANVGDQRLGVLELDLEAASNASSASIVSTLLRIWSFNPTIYVVMAAPWVQPSNRTLSGAPLEAVLRSDRPDGSTAASDGRLLPLLD